MFPHVLTKNQNFTVNFGQLSSPLKPLLPNFVLIGQSNIHQSLVRGPIAPQDARDCEVLMMIGLPGAGKTFWAENYKKSMPSKFFNILGTNSLIEKMKIEGLPRSRNYHGRWEVLIDKCTDCFNTILGMASKKKRNYILDQTNVFPTARIRKIKAFQDMCCKAIVVIPSDEEFQKRCTNRTNDFGKEIPDSAVDNMKANFVVPECEEISNIFSEVLYVELDPHSASQLVKKYNDEANNKGFNMTPAVRQYVNRNSQLKGKANISDQIGKHLPMTYPNTHITSIESTEEKHQGPDSLFPTPLNSKFSIDAQNSRPVKEVCNGMNSFANTVELNNGGTDEFGRDINFRSQILRVNNSSNSKCSTNRFERYNRDTDKTRSHNKYDIRYRRSRSRESVKRSRSRSWERKRRQSRRSRSRSRERRIRRRPRSRDRSSSRESNRSRDRKYKRMNNSPRSDRRQGMNRY